MKKEYVKPYIVVESFQLNAAIAAGCSKEYNNKIPLGYSMEVCTWVEENPGANYFGKACSDNVEVDGDGYDAICYHGPYAKATDVALES